MIWSGRSELPAVCVGREGCGVAPVCAARWAGIVPSGLPGRGLGAVADDGGGPAKCRVGGALAAGTAVCGAVEVRLVTLKRLVRPREMKPAAPRHPRGHPITSNQPRDE
jgi:hypothetical protein